MAPSRQRFRAILYLAVGLGLTGLVLLAYRGNVFRSLESSTLDTRFDLRGRQAAPEDIDVVGIDDVTFNALKITWPFPRSYEGRLVTSLHSYGAKVIALDIQFTERTTSKEDSALTSAVAGAGNVVLSTTESDAYGNTNVFGGDSYVLLANARVGEGLFPTDSGGIVRRVRYETRKVESFALVAAERATGRSIPPSALGGKNALIDYRGPPGSFRYASFSDVLAGKVDTSFFRGSIVVVGATAPSLHDSAPTSTTGAAEMSGPEIQANAIWTALHGFPLQSSGPWLTVLLIVGFGLLPFLAGLRLRPLLAVAVALGVVAAYAVAAQVAFDHGLVIPVVYPLVAVSLSIVGMLAAAQIGASEAR